MEKRTLHYQVLRSSFTAKTAAALMALAMVFCAIAAGGLPWDDRAALLATLALPLGAGLLFILTLLLLGRVALWTTTVPVLAGVAYAILRATALPSKLHMLLVVVLAAAAGLLWCVTVFNVLPGRWPLAVLFLATLVGRVALRDLALLRSTEQAISFRAGMDEMGLLAALLALFAATLAMHQRPPENPALPKIRDPKVSPPKPRDEPAPTAATAATEAVAETATATETETEEPPLFAAAAQAEAATADTADAATDEDAAAADEPTGLRRWLRRGRAAGAAAPTDTETSDGAAPMAAAASDDDTAGEHED